LRHKKKTCLPACRYNGKPDPIGECYKRNYEILKQVKDDKKKKS